MAGVHVRVALAVLALAVVVFHADALPCDLQHGACRCNATYCDTIEPIGPLDRSTVVIYETSKEGARLTRSTATFSNSSNQHTEQTRDGLGSIVVDRSSTYQTAIGFGGAFTDAATINIDLLAPPAKDNLMRGYFSAAGLEYALGRVPIGGCDFSTRPYTLDDSNGDLNLTHFALAPEDLQHKIPAIQLANKLRVEPAPGHNDGTTATTTAPLRLFASPWSAPYWMKSTNVTGSGGVLLGEPGGAVHQAWAQYLVRFLDAYAAHNITFWGLTCQNEPTDGLAGGLFFFNALGFTAEMMRDFIKTDLGPALRASQHAAVKLMMHDDQRPYLKEWAKTILGDAEAARFVDGIAVHWYDDAFSSPSLLAEVHTAHPDKFILGTEACTGEIPPVNGPILGSWSRGAAYAKDIIADLENWSTGWTDWNLALDLKGGPNWAKNNVDSAILIDTSSSPANTFYRNPMYYALGHFSKFIPPGAVRVKTTLQGTAATATSFVDAARGRVAVVVQNRNDHSEPIELVDQQTNRRLATSLPPHSIRTFVFSPAT